MGNLGRHCSEFHQHAITRGTPPITVDQGAPEDALKPGAHARAVSQLIAGLKCSHAKVLKSVFSVLGCSEATAKIAEERRPVLDESGSNRGFKRATALANGYTRRSGLPSATGPDMRASRGRRLWRHSPPRRLTTDSIRMAGDVACCRWRFGPRLADASQRGGGGGIDRRRRLKADPPTADLTVLGLARKMSLEPLMDASASMARQAHPGRHVGPDIVQACGGRSRSSVSIQPTRGVGTAPGRAIRKKEPGRQAWTVATAT
ncbi:hypothetical protein J2W80_002013 [Methylorubrum extorquens]|nr:hypothetical protein [Methylorubrum extorquens]MCP1590453.1 hypothetical protein [Methylorubrum extorquens]